MGSEIVLVSIASTLFTVIIIFVISYFIRKKRFPPQVGKVRYFLNKINNASIIKLYKLSKKELALKWVDKEAGIAVIAINTTKIKLNVGSQIWVRYSHNKIQKLLIIGLKEILTAPANDIQINLITVRTLGVVYED